MADLIEEENMTRTDAIKCLEMFLHKQCDLGRTEFAYSQITVWAAVKMAFDALAGEQWIPCSERMPKEREWIGTKKFGTTISDDVYVTFECPDGSRYVKGIRFQNGKVSSYEQITGAVPIAWMPLPEPYKEDDKGNR